MGIYKRYGEFQMQHLKKSEKNGQLIIAFMPIKPIFVEKILSGEKYFEYRRTVIRGDLTHMIIYATSPVKKFVAVAEVMRIHVSSPTSIWEKTKHAAGITRTQYRGYFKGATQACAIEIKKIIILDKQISPSKISNQVKVPQSFSYVNEAFYKKVLKLGKLDAVKNMKVIVSGTDIDKKSH
jgi:predicted transcriptional regulator